MLFYNLQLIINIYKELKSIQRDEISNKELRAIIRDIRKFLCEVEDDFKTNQYYIGMQYLFRGFAITN